MRFFILISLVFFVNTILSQSFENKKKTIDNIVYLTKVGFVTNVVIERRDAKMALLSNSDFAEIMNKRFSFDNSIGDSLKLYLTNGYNESSLWYLQISRYLISESLYQQISRSSPCEVYRKYFDNGYPKSSTYSFGEIRTAAAFLIKNNVYVSPDNISYYSIGESPCVRKKHKKMNKKH